MKKKQRTTVRLLRIRNPWGKREWKGELSVNSEKWMTALRNKLGKQSFAKGDGTFLHGVWRRAAFIPSHGCCNVSSGKQEN